MSSDQKSATMESTVTGSFRTGHMRESLVSLMCNMIFVNSIQRVCGTTDRPCATPVNLSTAIGELIYERHETVQPGDRFGRCI